MIYDNLLILIALAKVCTGTLLPRSQSRYVFKPEAQSTFRNSHVPELVDFADSQYDIDLGSSYWLSSYITSTNGKQYLAISHVLTQKEQDTKCRSSILDLKTLDYWVDLTYCTPQAKATTVAEKASPLNLDFGTYGYKATSEDGVSKMAAFVETTDYSINLSWEATSKVMLNGGGGIIGFGDRPANATHWGIPSAKTEGSLTIGDEVVEIEPKSTFTWYDRQISWGVPKNWTWFQVNFPGTAIKASIWAFETETQSKQFATIRVDESIHILAYTLTPDMTKTWTSPNTNVTYPLSWRLEFDNGDYLKVNSVRPDQEMYGSRHIADSAYEGMGMREEPKD
ncbi:hypothetical protein G7Z17_g6200 [Cylindrodendrum hubeiense]|uniref:AttH domain-containing protein n=1 Tax=Cylindrodendrum hubeiense TaxID=595255 RepID=A0A9P5HDM6_9HYPO|nr:hypothetical protein G7Z17_g6200 [Cylindrodendrum hubeiense]